MSTPTKIAVAVAVAVVLIAAALILMSQRAVAPTAEDAREVATTSSPSGALSTSSRSAPAAETTSGASFDADMANIDTQINAIAGDESDADRGLNDQPVEQAY